jgi:hypothetical protein
MEQNQNRLKHNILQMNKFTACLLIMMLTSFLSINLHAQEKGNPLSDLRRNSLNLYFGLFDEFNINYERNISQRPISSTSLRMGFGHGSFITAGDGMYINPSLVHLIGKKNSHLELNLGVKYIVNYPNPRLSLVLVPDLFVGYRYEKPTGWFIFRTGINWPTLINLGMGFKF